MSRICHVTVTLVWTLEPVTVTTVWTLEPVTVTPEHINFPKLLYNGMPSRLYEINHPYSLARALKAAVDRAVRDGDGEVLANVRAVILQMADAVRDYDSHLDGDAYDGFQSS